MSEYVCSKCKKVCKDKRGLSVHETRCGKTKVPICVHCNERYSSLGALYNHLQCCKALKQNEHNILVNKLRSEIEETKKNKEVRENELTNNLICLQSQFSEENKKHEKILLDLNEQINSLQREKECLHQILERLSIPEKRDSEPIKEIKEVEDPDYKQGEYVYIIQEREFIKEKRPLYKIGRTTQRPHERFAGYPKGSQEILVMKVRDCKTAERILKTIFSKKFKQDRTIGVEYFEGDVEDMKQEFLLFVEKTKRTQQS
jgi:hypothetical protein